MLVTRDAIASNEPRGDQVRADVTVDTRFRTLVGEAAWQRLPAAVRRRFSKRLEPGAAAIYSGRVVATELSWAGRVLAFLARGIGAPLPLGNGATGPAVVSVIEDPESGGQIWTRVYARPGRFPHVVHSAKRFRGPTGLEEYVGYGVGMALKVAVEPGALVFRSSGYFLEIGGWHLAVPRLLEPGQMVVVHREEGGEDRFSFRLTLTHPRLGTLIHQLAVFADE